MTADPSDGLPLDEVGGWALEKHERLRKYIDASRGARRKFIPPVGTGGASYIDLYCGSGRAVIRDNGQIIDGSPLVAFKCARAGGAPFSEIHLADTDPERRMAAAGRIARAGSAANQHVGTALEAVKSVAEFLNPSGLHFAFLDPYNLQDLPFSIIETLSAFQRMDMLIHVSVQDLQRNLDRYIQQGDTPLEIFAPGWRSNVNLNQSQSAIRAELLDYWLGKIRKLGVAPAQGIALVSGERNQRLYWLVFVSRSDFATGLWEDIRESTQRNLL
jgi:three-Cys-motif partner protein